MANNTRIYWLHCLTPAHIGTGRGIGYIDLPLYREQTTGWPAVPASGFKGVWADYHRATMEARLAKSDDGRRLKLAFGVANNDKEIGSNAGALIPTAARLVCLPVRSFMGTFAYCTSHLALKFLHRDLHLARFEVPPSPPAVPDEQAFVCGMGLQHDGRVYLEDLDLKAMDGQPNVAAWAEKIAAWAFPDDAGWQTEFKKRFTILPDLVFDYLTETGTEVITRVRIDDQTKTVADSQLWTEESLPAESILAGLVTCDRIYGKDNGFSEQQLLERFAPAGRTLSLQIGGKASVGRGQVRCVFTA